MPGDLFRETSSPHVDQTRQWYTVPASVLVHALVVAVLIIAPLMAADVLPTPRFALAYTQILLPKEPPPPAPKPAARILPDVASPAAAPLVAPEVIAPETGLENAPPAPGDGVITGVANG